MLNIEKKVVEELKFAPYNPREIREEQFAQLKKSIEEFGYVEPVIWNSRTGNIVGGHMRVRALLDLGRGKEEVEVVVVDLDEEKEKELNIRLNKNTGQWDWDVLANALDFDDLVSWGFDNKELTPHFDAQDMGDVGEDDVDEDPGNHISKSGDLFVLGKHRLLCGDATKSEDLERLMDGQKAQMCFTDPLYNVDYEGSDGMKIQNDSMGDSAFRGFLQSVVQQIINVTDGGIYICMSTTSLDTLMNEFKRAGGHIGSMIIWVKNTFTLGRADYQQQYEPILYGWAKDKKNHYFVSDRTKGNVWEDMKKVKTEVKDGYTTISFQGFKVRVKGVIEEGEVMRSRQRTDIWRYDKPSKNKEHPTMKPVALCRQAITASSIRGDIVLDPFGGSGSTMVAAQQVDRRCFMMELDPIYIDVIIRRWEKITGEKAIKQ